MTPSTSGSATSRRRCCATSRPGALARRERPGRWLWAAVAGLFWRRSRHGPYRVRGRDVNSVLHDVMSRALRSVSRTTRRRSAARPRSSAAPAMSIAGSLAMRATASSSWSTGWRWCRASRDAPGAWRWRCRWGSSWSVSAGRATRCSGPGRGPAQGHRSPRLKVIASNGRMLIGSSSLALAIRTHSPSEQAALSGRRRAGAA